MLALLVAASSPQEEALAAYWQAREARIAFANRVCALTKGGEYLPLFQRLNLLTDAVDRRWGSQAVSAARPAGLSAPPQMLCEDRPAAERARDRYKQALIRAETLVETR